MVVLDIHPASVKAHAPSVKCVAPSAPSRRTHRGGGATLIGDSGYDMPVHTTKPVTKHAR